MILAALVLAVGGFIFFIERHQATTDERVKQAGRIFGELDESAIVAVELRTSHGPVRLDKVDQEWRLVEPLIYPADETAVRSLIRTIAALDADRTVSLDEIEAADYGLDTPVLRVALVDEKDARFELAVGGETPLGQKRAVQRGQDDEIIFCSGAFVAAFDKQIDQWRSREVVDALERDLATIAIETASDLISATRVGDRWHLESPVVDLADGEQMRSLVSELNALRIGEFLSADQTSSFSAPEEWEYRVVLSPADGGEPVTLELAAPVEDATTVICRRNGEELISIPEGIRARLGKAPVLWRAPKVWPFSSLDAGKIEISNAAGSVVFDKVAGLWELEDGIEADSADVRRRLTALADLEVREHDLIQPPTEVMGSVILILDDEESAEGLTYTFYAPIEIGGHAALTVSSRNNVMGIDVVTAEMILGELDKLDSEEAVP